MLPTVLALCMQGESPRIQIPKAEMPVVSSHQTEQTYTSSLNIQSEQTFTSLFNLSPPPPPPIKYDINDILDTAEEQIGIRYVWGGTSRSGFDCSGFVKYVFAKHDLKLPRTSREQWKIGENVPRSELIPGDLIFFKNRNSRVSHVGIYTGDNMFIHASSGGGKIRVNEIEGYYANKYAGARRVLNTETN